MAFSPAFSSGFRMATAADVLVGIQGLQFIVDGTDVTADVQSRTGELGRRVSEVSTAQFLMRGLPANLAEIPEDGHSVEIKDKQQNRTLFGGTIRSPRYRLLDGGEVMDIDVRCSGHERRFRDHVIASEDAIRISAEPTAQQQVEELVSLLSTEGFTSSVPGLGARYEGDMRFRTIDSVLRSIMLQAEAIYTVSPDKEVSAVLLSGVRASGFTLDANNTQQASLQIDPKDHRTQQTVIGNSILRSETLDTNGTRTRFRLGLPGTPNQVVIQAGDGKQGSSVIWDLTGAHSLDALAVQTARSNNLTRLAISSINSINLDIGDAATSERLVPSWEANVAAITISVPGLDDLVLPGPTNPDNQSTDMSEPYQWQLTAAQAAAAVAGGLQQWRTDYLALSASARAQTTFNFDDGVTTAENIDIRSLSRLTVGGTEQAMGRSNSVYSFDPARQEVIATTAPAASAVVIATYNARNVSISDLGIPESVGRVEQADLPDLDAGEALAEELRVLHSRKAERIGATLSLTNRVHMNPGDTLTIPPAFASALQVDSPDASDVWLITEVRVRGVHDLLQYSVRCQRDRFETPHLEFWREFRRG